MHKSFTRKLEAVCKLLDVPLYVIFYNYLNFTFIKVYISTLDDEFRKPSIGMWNYCIKV